MSSYHGWTHAPKADGGTDPIPGLGSQITCLRGHHFVTGGTAVGSASETPITFYDWENEDSSIFGEVLFGGNLQKVQFLAQGVYTVTITIKWEVQFDGVTEVCWLDDSTTAGNWPFGEPPNMGQFGEGRAADSFHYPLTFSVTKKFPRYTTVPANVSGAEYGRVFVKVMQRSGTSKDLEFATLDVIYWGATQTSI